MFTAPPTNEPGTGAEQRHVSLKNPCDHVSRLALIRAKLHGDWQVHDAMVAHSQACPGMTAEQRHGFERYQWAAECQRLAEQITAEDMYSC